MITSSREGTKIQVLKKVPGVRVRVRVGLGLDEHPQSKNFSRKPKKTERKLRTKTDNK
jgi:outer membrane receptor for Fe3+-dicitrate